MTTYTKIADIPTSFTKITDVTTNYSEVADDVIQWKAYGGLIRLCTEGGRDDIMTEARIDYIVISHGEDVEIWTDIADIANIWTKINDI